MASDTGAPSKTRDWQRALRKLAALEGDPHAAIEEPQAKPVHEAIDAFLASCSDLAPGTQRNYQRTLRFLESFAEAHGIADLPEMDLEMIDLFRAVRPINALTWTKELQILRHFFKHCHVREWIEKNPAALVDMPKNVKPAPREPDTPKEVARIVGACEFIGRNVYERLRARAMVLLLRYTALRVSDVATLARDRIRNGEIHLYTAKNGKPVRLPIHPDLQAALDILPTPRAAGPDCRYYFWSGHGTKRAMVRDATRTLAVVFNASGVKKAHAHRFRHTLATEILEMGGTIDEAADILGNSPAIIRKHYAKWSLRRQERISGLMRRVFSGTNLVHEKTDAVNDWKQTRKSGGRHGTRTHDPGVANAVLSQLS